MDIVVVTGMSGAGKTVAGSVLEDFGYNCIDNIPVLLIPQFIDLYMKQKGKSQKIALVVDVRGCEDFSQLLDVVSAIKEKNEKACRLIYLDATTEVLINRYKESRHVHPLILSKQYTLNEAIDQERKMLQDIKINADLVLDTSKLSIALCRDRIISFISGNSKPIIGVSIVSFGFKYGIPSDSDLLFDVRCFPNPYYVDGLKLKTGLDAEVSDYVLSFGSVTQFEKKLFDMLDYLIPLYIEDGRSHLTISIGCTGGKHRSVTLVEALAKHLSQNSACATTVLHRDIKK
ncbi:MAG: RNase adapter RapZ [Clostridia bacterium]|nr:RNase adapter RapZ [Clostridia bacterium]